RKRDPVSQSPKGNNPKKKKNVKTPKQTSENKENNENNTSANSKGENVEKIGTEPNWVKKKKKYPRPDALVIETRGGISYANILKKVKTDPKLVVLGQNVKSIRKTAKGELLLELNKPAHQSTSEFSQTVKEVIGTDAAVRVMINEVFLDIKDIDEFTINLSDDFKEVQLTAVKNMRKAYDGTQTATIGINAILSNKLIELYKIRIGWVVCRIREKVAPRRCFKCLDFGHPAANCKNANDYTNNCLYCGEIGHKINGKKRPHYGGKNMSILYQSAPKPKQTLMRLLQLNLNHCQAAQDLLNQSVRELNIDVALLSEPYSCLISPKWVSDSSGTSAIWSIWEQISRNISLIREDGFVSSKVNGICIYSCYVTPRYTDEEFQMVIWRLTCKPKTKTSSQPLHGLPACIDNYGIEIHDCTTGGDSGLKFGPTNMSTANNNNDNSIYIAINNQTEETVDSSARSSEIVPPPVAQATACTENPKEAKLEKLEYIKPQVSQIDHALLDPNTQRDETVHPQLAQLNNPKRKRDPVSQSPKGNNPKKKKNDIAMIFQPRFQ
ncbi:hypothetical protein CVS40_6389, partial [Lucilia cuprina]